MIPKVMRDSIKLLIATTDTELTTPTTNGSIWKSKQFYRGVPGRGANAGAVVIDGGRTWQEQLLVNNLASSSDATGKPIKP